MILVTITSYVPFLCSVFPQPQASVYFINLPSTLLEVIFQFLNLHKMGLGCSHGWTSLIPRPPCHPEHENGTSIYYKHDIQSTSGCSIQM